MYLSAWKVNQCTSFKSFVAWTIGACPLKLVTVHIKMYLICIKISLRHSREGPSWSSTQSQETFYCQKIAILKANTRKWFYDTKPKSKKALKVLRTKSWSPISHSQGSLRALPMQTYTHFTQETHTTEHTVPFIKHSQLGSSEKGKGKKSKLLHYHDAMQMK